MTTQTPSAATPANWYRDPSNPAQDRYWDGATWTENVRPGTVGQATPPPMPADFGQPAQQAATGNGFSIAGIILGALAFLIFPIIFGPIGLIMGAIAKSKGERLATRALVVSGIGLVVGMIFGAMVGLSTF